MGTKTPPAVEFRRDLIVDAVLSASRVLVAVAARSLGDVAEEVTLTQYRTLVVLASRGTQTLAELAEAVDVMPPTATRMCDRLIKKGLIMRRHDRGDRRLAPVDAGQEGSRACRCRDDQEAFGDLPPPGGDSI